LKVDKKDHFREVFIGTEVATPGAAQAVSFGLGKNDFGVTETSHRL
jgi:hypothetical protein